MIVYIVTNKIDGKQYVGQHCGDNLKKYWTNNLWHAKKNSSPGKTYLYAAIRKHGPENFTIKPLVIVGTKWEMDYYEKGLIKAFNTKAPNGYNLTDGGEGILGLRHSLATKAKISATRLGTHKSEETRQKMSLAHSGEKHPFYGKHHTEDAKLKISVANLGNKHARGKKHSEESKLKMSSAHVGKEFSKEHRANLSAAQVGKRSGKDNPMFGRHHSEETKKKLSIARSNYWETRRLASLQSKIAP